MQESPLVGDVAVPLRQECPKTPANGFLHCGEVVLTLDRPDLEPSVIRPLGQPVFEHDHRRNGVRALQCRDVERFDAKGRLGKVEDLL